MMRKCKELLTKLIKSPVSIFIIFVFVNIIPTLELLYTEPLNFVGKVVLFIFPLGLYFILYSLSKKIGLVGLILFPLLFFHAFQIVVFSLFGEDVISADMVLNVLTTSVSEAGEVLDSLLPSVFFVIIVYIPATILAYKALRENIYLKRSFRIKAIAMGVTLIAVSYGLSFFAKNNNTDRFYYHEEVYPANLVYNLNFALDRWSMSNNYHETSKGFTFNARRNQNPAEREIYVLVVGETGRSENWSLYGYDRETTPRLAADTNIVFYRDAITQSNTTHKSVPIILSAASAEEYDILYKQKSIIEAFNEVDFTTVFLSNQSSNRTFTDFFAKEADLHQYFRFFGEDANEHDEIAVDRMKQCIDSISGDLFFVLHTYGSHFNYTERYPQEFAKYQSDQIPSISKRHIREMVNAYDNTTLYTDYVLNKITTILNETEACTAMFYASDHGEDLLDDKREKFLHASPKPTFYQLKIPYLFWFSPVYKQLFPEKVRNAKAHKELPVATNLVFHSFLDIAGIETDIKNSQLSILSKEFKTKERMYLDDHYNPIPYKKAGLKKQDLEMIELRKMQD